MTFDDWILALHLLSAFAYVAGMVVFWVLIVAVREAPTRPRATIRMAPVVEGRDDRHRDRRGGDDRLRDLARVLGRRTTTSGTAGSSPRSSSGSSPAASAGARARSTWQGMTKARGARAAGQTGPNAELLALNRTQRGVVLHTVASVALLLILIDMIWKPGAYEPPRRVPPDRLELPAVRPRPRRDDPGRRLLAGSQPARLRARRHAFAPARLLALLAVALPGYVVMRIGAQWIYSKEGWRSSTTTRRGSGSATSWPTSVRSSCWSR